MTANRKTEQTTEREIDDGQSKDGTNDGTMAKTEPSTANRKTEQMTEKWQRQNHRQATIDDGQSKDGTNDGTMAKTEPNHRQATIDDGQSIDGTIERRNNGKDGTIESDSSLLDHVEINAQRGYFGIGKIQFSNSMFLL